MSFLGITHIQLQLGCVDVLPKNELLSLFRAFRQAQRAIQFTEPVEVCRNMIRNRLFMKRQQTLGCLLQINIARSA
jgi:hypothetical protein